MRIIKAAVNNSVGPRKPQRQESPVDVWGWRCSNRFFCRHHLFPTIHIHVIVPASYALGYAGDENKAVDASKRDAGGFCGIQQFFFTTPTADTKIFLLLSWAKKCLKISCCRAGNCKWHLRFIRSDPSLKAIPGVISITNNFTHVDSAGVEHLKRCDRLSNVAPDTRKTEKQLMSLIMSSSSPNPIFTVNNQARMHCDKDKVWAADGGKRQPLFD